MLDELRAAWRRQSPRFRRQLKLDGLALGVDAGGIVYFWGSLATPLRALFVLSLLAGIMSTWGWLTWVEDHP